MTNFEHVRTIIKCTYKSAHYESKQLEFTPKNKDFMHFKASPVISKLCSKMFNKPKCSIVSKATSKSNSTNKVSRLLSMSSTMSFKILNSTVSVLYYY